VDFELDHVLVWVRPGAPEADRLVAFGLTEGGRKVHAGQGTANRCFFFRNAMLELIWVHDATEAQAPPGARLAILERWRHRETGASPFGLCLRRRQVEGATAPFETWPYRPAYLPAGVAIDVAATSPVAREPLVFLAPTRRPDRTPGFTGARVHAAGVQEISAVRIGVPGTGPLSATLQAVEATGVATFPRGGEPRLELGFDGERRGGSADFRPDLPLVFRW
jgi:hypothetical protein